MFLKKYLSAFTSLLMSTHSYLSFSQLSTTATIAYFVFSYIWLGGLNALFFQYYQLPVLRHSMEQSISEAVTNFPADLTITWSGSRLSVTPGPLAVPFPTAVRQWQATARLPEKLLTITDQEVTPTQTDSFPTNSLFVATPTTLYSLGQNNWNHVSLLDVPGFEQPFTIDRTSMPNLAALVLNQASSVLSLLLKATWLFYLLLWWVVRLWQVLLNSLLLFIILKLYRSRLTWLQVCKLSIAVTVLAELITQIAQLAYGPLQFSLFATSFWVIMSYVIFSNRQRIFLQR